MDPDPVTSTVWAGQLSCPVEQNVGMHTCPDEQEGSVISLREAIRCIDTEGDQKKCRVGGNRLSLLPNALWGLSSNQSQA